MSLRARLIWAFFLLAVLPLTGVSFYSYLTTERAYRRAVESEAAAMAEEMNGRLASVTRDLGHRFERVGELPFVKLVDNQVTPDPQMKEKLLADVRNEMGDAAPLVESLEFVPAPAKAAPGALAPPAATAGPAIVIAPAPPAPAVAGAPSVPEPPVWVVRMMEHRRAAHQTAADAQQARHDAGEMQRGERQADKTAQQKKADALAEERLKQAGVELAQQAMTAAALALSRDEKDRESAKQVAENAVATIARMGQTIAQTKMRYLSEWGYNFDTPVRRDGADLGMVRARVKPEEVLGNVFARTRGRQGEIPFAIDQEGKLYAADADKPKLQPFELKPVTSKARIESSTRKGDWLVVTRRDADSGLTLGIARPFGSGLKEIRIAAIKNLAYGLCMTGLAIVGILPLSHRLTRDLGALTEGASKLAHGDLDARVPVRSKDEVGRLAEAFNSMATDLRANQTRLLEQERLRKELEMGRRIQAEMLPHERLRVPFAEATGISIPAREVGGDFFNYFALDDGNAALLVGDVSGKGVGAALLMANLQATLRARMPLEKDLTALARHLDEEIDANTRTTVYLTAFISVLDGLGTMRYVNAGHNPPILLRQDGRVEALDSTGRPLGLYPGGGYEERQLSLGDGDWLFLYTDGVVESENDAGEPFGIERLKTILAAERGRGLDGVLAYAAEAVREFRGNHEAEDDATLVALKVGPRIAIS